MITFAIYWIGMYGLILYTYDTEKKGQMHWKVLLCLLPISLFLPVMFVFQVLKSTNEKTGDS